jgi:hypothetical protein
VELILLKTYGEMGDKVFDWMDQVGDDLGKDYISSIKRYYKN